MVVLIPLPALFSLGAGFLIGVPKSEHLNSSQRAMVAAKIANLSEGRPNKTVEISTVSQTEAAQTINNLNF